VGSRVNARFEHIFLAFEDYCVKVNTERPILNFMYSGTLVSGSVKLMRYSQGFPRKETSNDSGVARRAHVQLPSYMLKCRHMCCVRNISLSSDVG